MTPDVAEAIGLTPAKGALVTDVPEGPAMDAGMKSGDVIISFDGQEVEDVRGLVRRVGNTEVGKTVRMVVFRDGKTETLKVTLGRREEAAGAVPAVAEQGEGEPEAPAEQELLGLTVTLLTDELREQMSLDGNEEGLVIKEVDEMSEAYEKGLRAGDIITEAGQQKVRAVSELEDRVEEAREAGRKSLVKVIDAAPAPLLLLIRRAGEPRFVALTLE